MGSFVCVFVRKGFLASSLRQLLSQAASYPGDWGGVVASMGRGSGNSAGGGGVGGRGRQGPIPMAIWQFGTDEMSTCPAGNAVLPQSAQRLSPTPQRHCPPTLPQSSPRKGRSSDEA